ncbi:MAG: DNA polymerase III subunit beta [Candidatus Eisenbacteria bacterium]|jgi:DNA polymerase-3 subunit beta|nr:DNA polymerase III subunit beta [Candidatus Eisenbacteria bacterium]
MQVTLSPSLLGSCLRDLTAIIPSHPSSPILGSSLVTADEQGIWFWGTDLDVSGRFRVEGSVLRSGKAALPARRLADIVRQLPGDEMTLDVGDNKAEVRCGRSRFVMPVMNADDFPVFPRMENADRVVFPSSALARLVDGTVFCAGREESRPGLNSVLWEMKDDASLMVATDGRRLALMELKLKDPTRMERKFILPPKALNQIVRLAGSAENVTVGLGERFVSFELPQAALYTRELDVSYPVYGTVIPKETRLEMTVGREALTGALRRATIFAMPLTSQIRLVIDVGKLVLHAECPEVGEATEELDVSYEGESFEIGFNGKYLLDILSHILSERVVFKMNAPLKAALVVPEQAQEGESYTCLLMPLRLNE